MAMYGCVLCTCETRGWFVIFRNLYMDMTVGQAISISCSIIVVLWLYMAVYYAYMEPRELIRRDHALLEENTGLYGCIWLCIMRMP